MERVQTARAIRYALSARWSAVAVAFVSLALALSACGGDDDSGGPGADNSERAAPTTSVTQLEPTELVEVPEGAVEVSLIEWDVVLTQERATPGEVSFFVTNDGNTVHDFWVIRTDLAPEALPVDPAVFAVDASADGVESVTNSGEIMVGSSQVVRATLEAGRYVLICNIPTHYTNGMFTAFSVE